MLPRKKEKNLGDWQGGIHWDEDISIEGLLTGKQSGESQASFKKWLEARQTRLTHSTGRAKGCAPVEQNGGTLPINPLINKYGITVIYGELISDFYRNTEFTLPLLR